MGPARTHLLSSPLILLVHNIRLNEPFSNRILRPPLLQHLIVNVRKLDPAGLADHFPKDVVLMDTFSITQCWYWFDSYTPPKDIQAYTYVQSSVLPSNVFLRPDRDASMSIFSSLVAGSMVCLIVRVMVARPMVLRRIQPMLCAASMSSVESERVLFCRGG